MKSFVLRWALAGMAIASVVLTANRASAEGDGPYPLHDIHAPAHPLGLAGANFGDCVYRYYGDHDLFYNYYVGNNCGGYGAAMYVSPLPVPPHVGHTFITYQPLMPHEFLYKHHRTYHRYYNGGMGLTRTCVTYR